MIRAFMWKRWLPILLVAEVFCLMIAAGWAVHRHAAEQAAPAPRVKPAEWPYQEGGAPSTRYVAPPVPFRTDHPPADVLNLRPLAPEGSMDRSREKLEVRSLRAPDQQLPPGTKSFESRGATVYYDPLGH